MLGVLVHKCMSDKKNSRFGIHGPNDLAVYNQQVKLANEYFGNNHVKSSYLNEVEKEEVERVEEEEMANPSLFGQFWTPEGYEP